MSLRPLTSSPARLAAGVAIFLLPALVLSGCGKPQRRALQGLDPRVPAAQGLPPLPAPDQPAPLTERPPFGLFAEYPSAETLQRLSLGSPSPDGRYRAAQTPQGIWVARVDGAWLWQVPLPEPPIPGSRPTRLQGSVEWTPRLTLLLRDDTGAWLEANPTTAMVAYLPPALQGKELIGFSPDGKQVLYYLPGKTGRQLWLAQADGSGPKLLGENLIGFWDTTGKPVIRQPSPPVSEPARTPGSQPLSPLKE